MKRDIQICFLQWHITHTCNLRCNHCYQKDYDRSMKKETMLKVLDNYADLLKGRSCQGQINLTGGEPLLHPDFYFIAEEIRKRGYRLGILTNGTLIDDRAAARLSRMNPVFVQVSLDGTRPIHDSIRGEGSFERALEGIDALKRHGIRVLVSFTAQQKNVKSFSGLAKVCHRHRVDKLWWDRVVTDSREAAEAIALTTSQFRRLVKKANRLQRWYRRPDGSSMISNQRALQSGFRRGETPYRCSAGKNLLVVLADGDVMPCRRLPFMIGNVNQSSLLELIENSEMMRQLSARTIPKGCEGCVRLFQCEGGSRCVTYAQTGELGQKDVNCFYDCRGKY